MSLSLERQCSSTMSNMNERRRQTCFQILQTVCVTWALAMVGISDSMLGPSLLDLQALLQTDLGMLNYIVLGAGCGDFVGAILAGFLAKTADVHLRLCISVLIGALLVSLSAVVANFYYVLVAFCSQGLLRGFVYCYSIEKSNGIWRNKGVVFQIIALGTTAGGVIPPLIVNLFLCSHTLYQTESGPMSDNTTGISTIANLTNNLVSYTTNNASINSTLETMKCSPQGVKISYAFIILGVICLPPFAGFFAFWRKFRKTSSDSSNDRVSEVKSKTSPHRTLEIVFSVLFVIYYFTIMGESVLYSTFLTEFGVNGPLHLEKKKMVLMTSLFWGTTLAGRIINIIITPRLGVEKVIIMNIIPLLICEIVLICSVSGSEIILWVCTCALGIFMSPYLGTGYAWCAGFLKLNPKIISASSASLGLGGMSIPFIGGLFFQHFGPMSFLYFLFVICICKFFTFFIMLILGRKLKKYTISIDVSLNPSSQSLKENERLPVNRL